MPTEIRLARPEDLDTLVDLHLASFRAEDHLAVQLGRRYLRAIYRWTIDSPLTYILVAESEGRIAGQISVCDRLYTRPMLAATLGELLLALARRPTLLFERRLWARLLRRLRHDKPPAGWDELPAGLAQLLYVMVAEPSRGQGLFGRLVEAARCESRKRGGSAIVAGVYKHNEAARRAYLETGWEEWPAGQTAQTVTFVIRL